LLSIPIRWTRFIKPSNNVAIPRDSAAQYFDGRQNGSYDFYFTPLRSFDHFTNASHLARLALLILDPRQK
jgi:hypothetical protein